MTVPVAFIDTDLLGRRHDGKPSRASPGATCRSSQPLDQRAEVEPIHRSLVPGKQLLRCIRATLGIRVVEHHVDVQAA